MKDASERPSTLPDYTRGEENFNFISHIVGAAVGVAVLVLCVVKSVRNSNPWGLGSSIFYGITMILLYTVSTLYHGLRPLKAKKVFQVLDHCTIYLLIVGTYTPILLSAVRPINPAAAYSLLAVEFAVGITAAVFTAIDMRKYRVLSMICYIVLGWCAVFILPIAIEAVTLPGFMYLLAGGIVYTIGSVLYGIGKKRRYMHSVFHLFCLGGSLLQFVCVYFYCL